MDLIARLQQLIQPQPNATVGPGNSRLDMVLETRPREFVFAVYACALPVWFDADLLCYLVEGDPEQSCTMLDEIAALSCTMRRRINGHGYGYTYHKATRAKWLAWWRDPERQDGYRRMAGRLAEYVLERIRAYVPGLEGADYAGALNALDEIYPNVRAALRHASATDQYRTVIELTYTIADYQARRALWTDMLEFTHAALRACKALDDERAAADIRILMGNAWANLPSGESTQNLARAIKCYRLALQVYTDAAAPEAGAMAHNNLGNVYSDVPDEDAEANLMQAIAYYEAALQFWTPDKAPMQYAMVQNNLGVVHLNLRAGDRTEHVRQAIRHFSEALRYRTPEAAPLDYASTQNNLGIAYTALHAGNRLSNLQQAITCFREALRFWTPELLPLDYATVQNNLGIAYSQLPIDAQGTYILRAIQCYEEALRYLSPERTPVSYARTQNNLGIAYANYPGGDRQDNLERAIACYRKALEVEALPKWNRTGMRHNLSRAYGNRSAITAVLHRTFRRGRRAAPEVPSRKQTHTSWERPQREHRSVVGPPAL